MLKRTPCIPLMLHSQIGNLGVFSTLPTWGWNGQLRYAGSTTHRGPLPKGLWGLPPSWEPEACLQARREAQRGLGNYQHLICCGVWGWERDWGWEWGWGWEWVWRWGAQCSPGAGGARPPPGSSAGSPPRSGGWGTRCPPGRPGAVPAGEGPAQAAAGRGEALGAQPWALAPHSTGQLQDPAFPTAFPRHGQQLTDNIYSKCRLTFFFR